MAAVRLLFLLVAVSCGQLCNASRTAKTNLNLDVEYDPETNRLQFCMHDCKNAKCSVAGDICEKWCEPTVNGKLCMQRKKPLPDENCKGKWSETKGCSVTCGEGHKEFKYSIEKAKKYDGKDCEAADGAKKTEKCHAGNCPSPNKCFPAGAMVETPVGPKAMSEVRVGDLVRSVDGAGRTFFDTVYFFGHADASSVGTYMDIDLEGAGVSLQLSHKHYLPTCPNQMPCEWDEHVMVYGQDVKVGDYVWVVDGDHLNMRLVQDLSVVSRKGLYNPYTLHGKVVVNKVVASSHSDWVLDSWTPAAWTRYLPAVYQVLFLPGRWLYYMVGPIAADVLDVNNPQVAPENHGHGPTFLILCAMATTLAMGLISTKAAA